MNYRELAGMARCADDKVQEANLQSAYSGQFDWHLVTRAESIRDKLLQQQFKWEGPLT